jgi:cell division protein FtsB
LKLAARSLRRAIVPALVLLTLAVLLVGVFPTRTYLAQRRAAAEAQEKLDVLETENELLASRVEQRDTDAEIERLAREQYGLVRPGEEAYAIRRPRPRRSRSRPCGRSPPSPPS